MRFVNKSRETSGGLKMPQSWFGEYYKENQSQLGDSLLQKIQESIDEIGGGEFFIKLSTRSPKDSKILRDRGG